MGKVKATGVRTVQAVIEHMRGLGLPVAKTKIYKDISKGALVRQDTGVFLEKDLAAYAETLRKKPGDAGQINPDRAALELRKLQMEIARLEGVVRRQDREYEIQTGKLCKSSDFYRALAERVSILRSRFNTLVRTGAIDYVKMSPDDFVDAITADFALLLHEFSRPPEYDSEDVPDAFKNGQDVAGKTETQEKSDEQNDED